MRVLLHFLLFEKIFYMSDNEEKDEHFLLLFQMKKEKYLWNFMDRKKERKKQSFSYTRYLFIGEPLL